MSQLGLYRGIPRDAIGYLNAADPIPLDGFRRQNMPRIGLTDSAGDAGNPALAAGVMTSALIALAAGDLVTNITFFSGATAGNAMTNQFAALYSPAGTPLLIGQSPDGTSGAWAAKTAKTFTLTSPYRVERAGLYSVGLNVAGTTPPSLLGTIGAPPVAALGERRLAQTSGAALTATAPPNISAAALSTFVPLVVIS